MTRCAAIFAIVLLALVLPSAPQARAADAIAVVVNKANPVDNITIEELRRYCIAERKYWKDGKRVTVVLRDPGQAERSAVLQFIYRMTEADYARHFLQAEFTGEVQTAPKHLATANGVVRFVFNVPGAIGFVRAGDLDPSVKVVRVNGLAPGDPRYPLLLSGR